MRLWFSALAWIIAAWIAASEACADDVLIFLDRSPEARSEASTSEASTKTAVTVAHAAVKAGHRVRVFVQGQARRGHQSHELNVRKDAPGFREPVDRFDGYFERSPDPRAALRQAVLIKKDKPLWILFVGPFDASADPIPSEANTLNLARQRWNRAAPDGSHVTTLGMTDAGLARLDAGEGSLRGRVKDGYLVLGVAEPLTVKTDLLPAFREPKTLTAHVAAKFDALVIGKPDLGLVRPGVYLMTSVMASSELDDDVWEREPPETLGEVRYKLTRTAKDGTVATVKLERAQQNNALWLSDDLPQPLSFEWDAEHTVGARLLDAEGKLPGVLIVKDAKLPVRAVYTLQHVGLEDPVWEVEATGSAWRVSPLEAGLSVDIGDGVKNAAGWTEHEVTLTYAGETPHLSCCIWVRAKGTKHNPSFFIDIRVAKAKPADPKPADPVEPTAPVVVEKPTPPVVVEKPTPPDNVEPSDGVLDFKRAVDFPDDVRLPMVSQGLRIALKSTPPGRPAKGQVVVTARPKTLQDALLLEWTGADGKPRTANLGEPIDAQSGQTFAWRVAFRPDAPVEGVPNGTLQIFVKGREARTHTLPAQVRVPRFIVHEGDGARYIVNRDGMTAANPIIVRLDPDGTSGAWLTKWSRQGPTVSVDPRGIQDFEVRRVNEPDTWHVMPVGPWRGKEPKIFDPHTVDLQIRISDAAGKMIGIQALRVTIAPRWGSRGWILVGLAALAALLGLATIWHLRPQPLTGTLLYTADALTQTVGKLDLSRLRRKKGTLYADANGRLSFSRGIRIARIVPTRVGGMIEFPRDGGATEKRLLVESMAVRIGEHSLRYVSGSFVGTGSTTPPRGGPDLLGPDFDMPTGQVDEAYRQAKKEWEP